MTTTLDQQPDPVIRLDLTTIQAWAASEPQRLVGAVRTIDAEITRLVEVDVRLRRSQREATTERGRWEAKDARVAVGDALAGYRNLRARCFRALAAAQEQWK